MEAEYRLGAFLSVFVIMAVWEQLKPRRIQSQLRSKRWPVNIGLMISGALLVRLTIGAVAYKVAVFAETNGYGLLNLFELNTFVAGLLAIILLDLIIYGQHVLSHKLPLLWKLHQVHHADLVYDTTTGIRFHPLEIFFSMLVKGIAVLILGADPMAVIIFEMILNSCAVFNHGNVSLPAAIDRQVRKLLVTPDMHRVHHSVYHNETDSNYGFSISIWDRLFGTYNEQPRDGHTNMKIGLQYSRQAADTKFLSLMMLPFKKQKKSEL